MGHSTTTTWQPGQKVKLVGPSVSVQTLLPSDVDDSIETWVGSPQRNAFVWKPKLPARDYMLALIRHCDGANRFVFAIRARAPAREDEQSIIGYHKVQLVTEDNGRGPELTAIPTTVIGDAWAGQAYGQKAAILAHWFLLRAAHVQAVSPRIYEANEPTWRLAERLGYRLVRRFQEGGAPGSGIVRHYTMSAQELQARHAEAFLTFRMETIATS